MAMVAEMLMETESDFRMDLAMAALVEKETKDEYLRMEEALEEIATKTTFSEMTGANLMNSEQLIRSRDRMIGTARGALPKKGEA